MFSPIPDITLACSGNQWKDCVALSLKSHVARGMITCPRNTLRVSVPRCHTETCSCRVMSWAGSTWYCRGRTQTVSLGYRASAPRPQLPDPQLPGLQLSDHRSQFSAPRPTAPRPQLPDPNLPGPQGPPSRRLQPGSWGGQSGPGSLELGVSAFSSMELPPQPRGLVPSLGKGCAAAEPSLRKISLARQG